jgi:alpha-1,3-glucosyltransferase
VSLGFFLASFQVHEKAILLPALPLALLAPALPAAASAFAAAATWSMWPLLVRDGLAWPALLLGGAYVAGAAAAGGGSSGGGGFGQEAAALSIAARVLGVPLRAAGVAQTMRAAFAVGGALAASVAAGACFFPRHPEGPLPFLWEYLSAALAAAAFCCFWMLAISVQLAWTARDFAGAPRGAAGRGASSPRGGAARVPSSGRSRSRSVKKLA